MSYRMPDSRVCSIMFPLGSNIWPPVTSYSFSSVTQNNKTSYRSTPVPIIKNVPSVPYKNSYQTPSTTLRSLSGVESYLFLSFIIAVHFHFAIKSFKHSKTSIYFKEFQKKWAVWGGRLGNILFKFLDQETFEEAVGLKIICQLTLLVN